jgi:large subunit ribosomal protein L5
MSILKEKYQKEVAPVFREKFGVQNAMAVPRITKVVLNAGIGKYLKEKEAIDEIASALKNISGQQPILVKAKKSISGFKVREGQEVGVKVTLRGERMWSFLDKLVASAFPRVRDFQGIDPKNIDNQGNFNIAIKEHFVFPEISAESVKTIFSFQVTIVNTAENREQGEALFKALGFPIKTHKLGTN